MGSKFKVTSLNSDSQYGIVASDLKSLMDKGCQKLRLSRERCRVCLFEDGTEVDAEYFLYLKDNCKLIILEKGQKWDGEIRCCLNKILQEYDNCNDELITAASNLLSEEIKPRKRKLLQYFVEDTVENITAEHREDDQKWFEETSTHLAKERRFRKLAGLLSDKLVGFKSGVVRMIQPGENEIDSFIELNSVKNHADKLEGDIKINYCLFVKNIEKHLQQNKCNGCYFDRRENDNNRLCTPQGWFTCQGAFDEDSCSFIHSINPYGSREKRIVFSTWNLDHVIEKKRTIIPTIVNTVKHRKIDDRKVERFYSLLFTRANLKLVHIVCHKKTEHKLSCDLPTTCTRKKRKRNNM